MSTKPCPVKLELAPSQEDVNRCLRCPLSACLLDDRHALRRQRSTDRMMEARRLYEQGLFINEIADRMGFNRRAVSRWLAAMPRERGRPHKMEG